MAREAAAAGIAFTKAGNCLTAVADLAGLARIADALSQDAAVGRLGQVCQRWILQTLFTDLAIETPLAA